MVETRRYLDFEIIKESWNIYNLSDGTKIKTRNMLKKAWYVKKDDKKSYSCDLHTEVVIMCDPALQGIKNQTKFSREQLGKAIEVPDCRYDTLSYEPEEYLLDENIKILIHSNMTQIARTKLFDAMGDRIYQVEINASITITPPKQG